MASRGGSRVFWLLCGGTVMGIGLWAALYVGMLAFSLPVPIHYHYPTLGMGLLAAIFSTTVGLFAATRNGRESRSRSPPVSPWAEAWPPFRSLAWQLYVYLRE